MRSVLDYAPRHEAEEFAALLERARTPHSTAPGLAALVALARSLAPAAITPVPGFRAALRERLIAEAAVRLVTVPAPRTSPVLESARSTSTRIRKAAGALALVSVVSGAGAAAASMRALPGDALYGLKRQIESVQLALAFTDLARGTELLDQAGARLGEAERLAASGRGDEPTTQAEIGAVLGDWATATDAGAEALTTAYRETGSEEPMRVLERFVTDSQERLQDLMLILDPSLRAQVRAALETLGRLGAQATAVLPVAASGPGTAGGSGATSTALATGDGWAVSRVLDHLAEVATRLAAGDAALAPVDGTAGSGVDGTGTATGDAVGSAAVAAPDGSGASGTSGTTGTVSGTLPGAATSTTTDPLPTLDPSTSLSTPEATLSVTDPLPAPTVSDPLPTLPLGDVTTPSVTSVTSGTALPCAPLPPLTSC